MDDELSALFGDSPSEGEPFGDFADPTDLGFGDSSPAAAAPVTDDEFGAAFFDELGAATTEDAPIAASRRGRKRGRQTGSTGFMGLTPQQRMILAIFLFLDVSVLGCFILVAIGAINL